MENISDILIAYQNELNSPEILPYKDLTTNIKNQKEKIAISKDVIKTIYEQDFERVNFFITQYLKARLAKLNKHTDRSCLSVHEKNLLILLIWKMRHEMGFMCVFIV